MLPGGGCLDIIGVDYGHHCVRQHGAPQDHEGWAEHRQRSHNVTTRRTTL